MIDRIRLISVAGLLVLVQMIAPPSPASAQDAIRCSSFLHNRDGTWRSFYHADLFGQNGVVHIEEGERLSPASKGPKGEIARSLNELCAGQ